MKCWICGDNATTGEHKTKASDLRAVFGDVSQEKPLYVHNAASRNLPAKSIKKSDILKHDALLCQHCNNERTQPYDRAWQQISEYVRAKPFIRGGDLIHLQKIFPEKVHQSMLMVHLFFVKHFGCMVVESEEREGQPEIKESWRAILDDFSKAILEQRPQQNVHLAFSPYVDKVDIVSVGCSDLLAEYDSDNHRIRFATWMYILDKFSVCVMYAQPNEHRKRLVDAWHPSTVTKCIRIASF